MFDSRTDKPVKPGGHSYGGATNRYFSEPGWGDQIELGTPRSRQMCTPVATRMAIEEGLADYHAEQQDAMPTPRECPEDFSIHGTEGLLDDLRTVLIAAWEDHTRAKNRVIRAQMRRNALTL